MAQYCTYVLQEAWPLPIPAATISTQTVATHMALLRVRGPATSVGAGMAINGLSADFTTIVSAMVCNCTAHDVYFQVAPGTSNAVASLLVHATRPATGLQLSNAVNLNSTYFDIVVFGSGPMASALAAM